MGLFLRELERLSHALQSLTDATLQDIFQPSPHELILELRHAFRTRLLLFSIRPGLARAHPIEKRPPNPQNPLPFQMLCRSVLAGRLVLLEPPSGDRILRLTFQGHRRLTLVAELFDRRGALVLLDEEGLLLGAMRGGEGRARPDARALLPGQPYQPPPPLSTGTLSHTDRFAAVPSGDLPEAICAFFSAEAERQARESFRLSLLTALRREGRRLERLLHELASDLQRAETAEQHRRFGDLLQIHLKTLRRGMTHLTVPDLFQEEQPLLEIPLDPLLDPVANLQRHYRLYRKYDASIVRVLERIETTERALRQVQRWLLQSEEATHLEGLQRIHHETRLPLKTTQAPPSARQESERKPYHRYFTRHGREIRVGRSASENDTLTFRTARGNDFWLHVRGRPGAHVVIPAASGVPDLETLLDAGALALKHSGLPDQERAEVAWTRVKYVRKVAGGAPGQVTFSQDKTLWLEQSEERLAGLTREEG